MKTTIILALLASNYVSIVFVGKYKKISEVALEQASRAVKVGHEFHEVTKKFELLFNNCVKRNAERDRR